MDTSFQVIYHGPRDSRFKTLIQQVLTLSRLEPEYRDLLLDDVAMDAYAAAFTHPTVNATTNYEHWEFLGDVTVNKAVAWYLSRRFPQLNCPRGVKILTRLKINLISSKSFCAFAKRLRFWDFVSAREDIRSHKMNKVLEDVFEAFFGVTEYLLDERVRRGVGEHFCYNIVAHLLDTVELSLQYEDLFDAKTRLKETFDHFGESLGVVKYTSVREDGVHHVCVKQVQNGRSTTLATACSPVKSKAEQTAAQSAIATLGRRGFTRPVSGDYLFFSKQQ